MRKRCRLCGKVRLHYKKTETQFQSICCKCQNSYTQAHYRKYKKKYIKKAMDRKSRLYDEIIKTRKQKPCADCKQSFPVVCMDFDHVRGKKKFNIAASYDRYSLKVVLEELGKCDVVCSNCHRIRTNALVA